MAIVCSLPCPGKLQSRAGALPAGGFLLGIPVTVTITTATTLCFEPESLGRDMEETRENLLVTKGIATSSKHATRSSWPYY